MFSVLKFLYLVIKNFRDVLNPNINPLRHMPIHIRYFASILLACFWCLVFGLFFGELLMIGYNMLGHIAIVSMAFATWAVFKTSEIVYGPRAGTQEYLRSPDRSARCDEMTEEQRMAKIREWNARNVWNDAASADSDRLANQNNQDNYHGA